MLNSAQSVWSWCRGVRVHMHIASTVGMLITGCEGWMERSWSGLAYAPLVGQESQSHIGSEWKVQRRCSSSELCTTPAMVSVSELLLWWVGNIATGCSRCNSLCLAGTVGTGKWPTSTGCGCCTTNNYLVVWLNLQISRFTSSINHSHMGSCPCHTVSTHWVYMYFLLYQAVFNLMLPYPASELVLHVMWLSCVQIHLPFQS